MVFCGPPWWGFLDMDGGRGACESAEIDGIAKGFKREEGRLSVVIIKDEKRKRKKGRKKEPTILHRPVPRTSIFLNQHPNSPRITPILGMRLPRLKNGIQPEQLHRIHNLPRQRIPHRKLFPHPPALRPRPIDIEVKRIETLIFFYLEIVGGG